MILDTDTEMAAVSSEELGSHDKAEQTTAECVVNLIKKLRDISTKSLIELKEVNQFFEKLEIDDSANGKILWGRETDDPIMTFDLENLRQAFREAIILSGGYKAACKNLERHLLKLEEHHSSGAQSPCLRMEREFSCVARCISRCCVHVDEYGSNYNDVKRRLCDIIDKYCTPHIKEQSGVQYFWSLLQSLSILNDQTEYSQDIPLHSQLMELEKAKKMTMAVVEGSKIAKKRWLELNAEWTALQCTETQNE